VDYLVNDMSLHGQFHDAAAFVRSVDNLMEIRGEINRLGSALYCHRKLKDAQVTPQFYMQRAVQWLPVDKRRALMSWLANAGPYWEDARLHSEDDYLAVAENIVTDSAIGEAALCISRDVLRELVSFSPSNWQTTPIVVDWVHEDGKAQQIHVTNHWTLDSVKTSLQSHPIVIDSWASLADHLRHSCTRLTFSDNAFQPLQGHPFAVAAAVRIRVMLHTLNEFKGCFNESGERNEAGHRLLENHFTGENAWFSDSSATEKRVFEKELTFSHPDRPDQDLFCPWHGKVQTPPYRIHFSWPVTRDGPVYVVYIGPKLSKR
jgi:hypothetical protein